jgi:predicted hydrocarbon binding protein
VSALQERLVFDVDRGEVRDETRRYLLLRPDVLMGLFAALSASSREEALRAFGRSVAAHGSDSIRAYAAAAGTGALPAMMEDAAASLGWGRWTIERRERELRLTVRNSPFAAGAPRAAGPVCHAIAGMLEGLAAVLWGGVADAHETACAAANGGRDCRFVARAAADPPANRREPP